MVSSSEHRPVVDPDVDLHDPAQASTRQWDVVAAVSAGGVLGALARYAVSVGLPHADGAFPWSTVVINVTGCLLIGVLMVFVQESRSPHRLVRPFLGVGILGGYTTYSTFAVDAERLLAAHRPGLALAYVALTMVACALAVWLATTLTRRVGGGR